MTHHVLIVEDESDLVDIIEAELELDFPSIKLTTAATVDDLQSVLERKSFQLIIADLTVPGSQITPVLDLIREVSSETPIMVFSGKVEEMADLDHPQVIDFIPKPFQPEKLLGSLKKFFDSDQLKLA
ncbi:response regulator [Pseudobacteriovorax antillogorgiicola]|uniref:Response regulator receiver domain-containing protein n=1 Tax=Pseudobacteriovorax antillogorgiicola TaxID=1513793 RepID=A0A1Y6BPH1_9BACT|nr:response regulator [Pseudobacteriovorax antillogorgiicola]TCS55504.1 response regulator receiver domain-containing protein [Pseudobacteriovorax antillogorgiicola]SMF11561.1 Response regulator receiver domain-containing protein [Pseudobacteriovorax antillogorgiicola]